MLSPSMLSPSNPFAFLAAIASPDSASGGDGFDAPSPARSMDAPSKPCRALVPLDVQNGAVRRSRRSHLGDVAGAWTHDDEQAWPVVKQRVAKQSRKLLDQKAASKAKSLLDANGQIDPEKKKAARAQSNEYCRASRARKKLIAAVAASAAAPTASFGTAASGTLGGGLGGGLGGRKKKLLPPTNEWGGGYTVVPRPLPPFAAPPQQLLPTETVVSPGGFGSVFGLDGQHAFGMESTPAWLSALHGGGGMHTPMAPGQLTPVGPSGGHNGGGGGGGGDGGGGSSHASFAALLSVISSAAYKGAHAGALSGAGSEIPGAIVKAAARLEGRFDDLENKFEEMREAGQAAAEAGQAAAEGTQAQVASVLAATHAVGNSVQAVGTSVQAVGTSVQAVSTSVQAVGTSVQAVGTSVQAVSTSVQAVSTSVQAVGQRVEAVGQRVEDNIVVTTQMKMLAAANTASLQALAKATQESKRQELLASLANLESACQEEAVQEARHAQLLAQFHHVEAVVSLHRAAGSTPATGTPAAGTPAAEAPVSLAQFPLEASTASAKRRESMASSAAASAKRPKTTGVAVGVAFGGSYRLRDENSTMPARFNAKRVPPGQPSGQPLSPSGKGNRGL
jgi:hypothetical protein